MNLKFKSREPDLKFNIQSQFRILNQNVLYLTRNVDDIKRILTRMNINQNLQTQVNDYFEDGEAHPESGPEDSKQDGTISNN